MKLELTRPLDEPTPVEEHDGRYYKRDDLLGFTNGVNGKTRTSLFLARKAIENGAEALVYGGSVKAPALGRVASAAAYSGLDCYLVIGSDLRTAIRHPTVEVAREAGASFIKASVAYNPALQKKAREIAAGSDGYIWQVPYGVSTPEGWEGEQLADFLWQDAPQVANLPSELDTLVVPFGSGNAASGVLYGLSRHAGAPKVNRVVLMGIGPDRSVWMRERLARAGLSYSDLPFELEHIALHPNFATYNDLMPEREDGIDFHPTYEGKMVRYLNLVSPSWWTARDGSTCMWIVGGPL